MRRVTGATTSTTGKAVAPDSAQLPSHTTAKRSTRRKARQVDRPATMQDIIPYNVRPNS